jgi:dienelactone hydrolase
MKKQKTKYFTNLFLFILIITLFISGCSSRIPTHEQRVKNANSLIKADILRKVYSTKSFNLLTYSSLMDTCQNKPTNIYIEGDGLAWVSSSKISDDPTPINPIALKMFTKDDSQCKVYIARPCQYIKDKQCHNKYWTSHRFSKKVIESYDEILEKIKKEHDLKKFQLIGYSGGGAIAALVAARRSDIATLVTVAGNLDTEFWAKKHRITPLNGSLNPADFTKQLENISQFHLIGEKDKIIDKSIFESYSNRFTNKENINFKIIKDFTHNCCWSDDWQKIKSSAYGNSKCK